MSTRWYYRVHGRDVGPIEFSTLQLMAKEERLFVDDEIRAEGSDQWVAAETVPGLFPGSADEDDLSSMLAEADAPAPDTEFIDSGDRCYCRTRTEELGPMPRAKLMSLVRSGRLARRDQVRIGAHGNWVEARSVEGLFDKPDQATQAASSMLEGFEIVADPTPRKARGPLTAPAPAMRMEDDDVVPVAVPDVDAEWSCRVLGQEIGPMSWADLRELVETRQLGPNDRVRKANSVAWVPAATINDLFPKRTHKKKSAGRKKLSDDDVLDILQPGEPEPEISSHMAPQRSFERSPRKSSPAIPASRPTADVPVQPPAASAPRPAAAPTPTPPPRPAPAPKREKRPMGNPFAGLGRGLGGLTNMVASAWKPIAAVVAVLLIVVAGIYGGGSLFSSGSGKPDHFAMSVALWHEAQAFRRSKNEKAWTAFCKRYSGRIGRTAEQLETDAGDPVTDLLLECYRDYLPKMLAAPVDGADDAWQKMEESMTKAESLR